jgi:hypothetical protein
VVLPALDDGIGEHAGTSETARDRQLERLGDEDLGLGVALSILEYELGTNDACDDERRGAALDRFADILADALEGICCRAGLLMAAWTGSMMAIKERGRGLQAD